MRVSGGRTSQASSPRPPGALSWTREGKRADETWPTITRRVFLEVKPPQIQLGQGENIQEGNNCQSGFEVVFTFTDPTNPRDVWLAVDARAFY